MTRSDFIKDFFLKTNDLSINVCLWKNVDSLQRLDSGDFQVELDLYVDRSHFGAFKKLLFDLRFKQFNPYVASFPSVYHFFKYCDDGWLHFNCYTQVITGESQTKLHNLPSSLFDFDSIVVQNVPVLNPDSYSKLFLFRYYIKLGSLISLMRTLLDKRDYELELKHIKKMYLDKSVSVPANFFDELDSIFSESIFRKIYIIFYYKFRYYKYLRMSLLSGFFIRYKSFAFRIINKIFIKRKRYINNFDGIIIGIAGTDGSGKTSVSKNLLHTFQLFDCCSYNVGRLIPAKYYSLSRIFARNKRGRGVISSSSSVDISGNGFAFNFKSIIIALVRNHKMRKAVHKRSKGYIVVIDRVLSRNIGAQDGPRIIATSPFTRLLSRIESFLYECSYQPDIVFRLNVSLENALARNQSRIKVGKETDAEIHKRFNIFSNSKFDNLAVVDVDANSSFANVNSVVINRVLDTI